MKIGLLAKRIFIGLLIIIVLAFIAFIAFNNIGQSRWKSRGMIEDTIFFDGREFGYDEDIVNFLFLCTDKVEGREYQEDGSRNYIKGGQADVIVLLSLNMRTSEINVVSVPRSSMAEIVRCDKDGKNLRIIFDCICLQHGYGDGGKVSCERTVKAVSKMLKNTPIHAYAAINMSSVAALNDLVGGVDLEILEQIPAEYILEYEASRTRKDEEQIKKEFNVYLLSQPIGTKVHLDGKNAFHYLRWREKDGETIEDDGTLARPERQVQYIKALMGKVVSQTKDNPLYILKIYKALTEHIVTDITMPELVHLMPTLLGVKFDNIKMHSINGEYKLGDNGYYEYYIDDYMLNLLLNNLFFTKEIKRW